MKIKPSNFFQTTSHSSARDKLVQAAMHFFGERGTSVSMLEISAAAGNKNKSAVTYHFEDKKGLINAVYNEICSFLEPRFETLLRELEAKRVNELSLYEIILALNAPFFALYASKPNGSGALKALARMSQDSPIGDESMYRIFLANIFNRFAVLILRKVPKKPIGQLKFHLAHYLVATMNGLAVTDRWQEADFLSDPELIFELLLSYTDYVSGGMAGYEFQRPPFEADRWRQAIKP